MPGQRPYRGLEGKRMKEKATAAKNVTPKVHNTSDISIILTKALLS